MSDEAPALMRDAQRLIPQRDFVPLRQLLHRQRRPQGPMPLLIERHNLRFPLLENPPVRRFSTSPMDQPLLTLLYRGRTGHYVVRAWNSLQDFSSLSATDQQIITLSRGLSEKEVSAKWFLGESPLSS